MVREALRTVETLATALLLTLKHPPSLQQTSALPRIHLLMSKPLFPKTMRCWKPMANTQIMYCYLLTTSRSLRQIWLVRKLLLPLLMRRWKWRQ